MIKIGLTGGIASGKSTVSQMLTELGFPVIDADVASRKVVEKGKPALKEIEKAFGSDVIQSNGELDRKKLGGLIFKDATKRQMLNEIVHPRVRAWMRDQIMVNEQIGQVAVVLDIPLLIESTLKSWADRILLVYVPEEVQIKRLMDRDDITREDALLRINSQMPLDEKRALADRIINNQGSILESRSQLLDILEEWKLTASHSSRLNGQ